MVCLWWCFALINSARLVTIWATHALVLPGSFLGYYLSYRHPSIVMVIRSEIVHTQYFHSSGFLLWVWPSPRWEVYLSVPVMGGSRGGLFSISEAPAGLRVRSLIGSSHDPSSLDASTSCSRRQATFYLAGSIDLVSGSVFLCRLGGPTMEIVCLFLGGPW